MKRYKRTSASELAQMGYCEKKMLFAKRIGERISPAQADARMDGLAAHKAFHEEAVAIAPDAHTNESKPWCFIASELFGQSAYETAVLRMFRDRVLRRYAAGRCFIRVYYRHSPNIARWLRHHLFARKFAGAALRIVVAVLNCRISRQRLRRGAE